MTTIYYCGSSSRWAHRRFAERALAASAARTMKLSEMRRTRILAALLAELARLKGMQGERRQPALQR